MWILPTLIQCLPPPVCGLSRGALLLVSRVQDEAGSAADGAGAPRQHGLPEPGGLPLNGLPGDPAATAALIDRLQRELRTVAALEVGFIWCKP